MSRTAIIGAGITGVTTAYQLQEIGEDVLLFERHPYAAMETSYANGGQISASNAEVWNHSSTVLKGLKLMLRSDAPLLVNPFPSWHKYSWFAEFLLAIRRYRSNTIATAKMAVAARRLLLEMAEREGIAFDLEKRGILHIYRDAKSLAHAAKVNSLLREGGVDRRTLDPAEIQSIEPALSGCFVGGFFTPGDFSGDIHRYTAHLSLAVSRRGGECRFDTEVRSLHRRADGIEVIWEDGSGGGSERFDRLVICGGIGSRRLAAMLGDRVNVYPVKGYSITVQLTDAASQAAAPWVSLLDDAAKIVSSRLGKDRFRIAGTAEYNGVNYDIRAARIAPLVHWCRTLFPGVNIENVVPWAGLRPMMPDMMPRVRASRHPAVYYNTGHGHLGWTLSAVTAWMTAQMVLNDRKRAG